ncbi:MAG: hypothetical protein A2W73_11010 [Deltaproteobacteria bacterium RIFCSPLOWO2_12_55_13]|nr:MAG: hypothetical protein A2W73_11010 [Deltaproteobacteria bacterium RIFCSPLOWO2_12_55_13]
MPSAAEISHYEKRAHVILSWLRNGGKSHAVFLLLFFERISAVALRRGNWVGIRGSLKVG